MNLKVDFIWSQVAVPLSSSYTAQNIIVELVLVNGTLLHVLEKNDVT